MATSTTTMPASDFNSFHMNPAAFNEGLNAFMEANISNRVESVITTVFDLSNNNNTGLKLSYGDFIDAALPICQTGGCGFAVNDAITGFGARARGFLNVTTAMAGKPIHFGFYADDAVSLTFYDKDFHVQPVIIRPHLVGFPTWRTTNTVTFMDPGLYPLEILYIEIGEHAALEMSYYMDTFTDFELAANTPGSTNLKTAGFTLFPATSFFQTLSGAPSYQDADQCKQCDRQFVNQPGNSGCDSGYYCNEAALCAPCDSALFCGPTCSPCGGATPFCIDNNGTLECGGCRTDADCEAGFTCDLSQHECSPGGGSGGSGGGNTGSGTAAGAGGGGNGDSPGAQAGCGCRMAETSRTGGLPGWLVLVLAALRLARPRDRVGRLQSGIAT